MTAPAQLIDGRSVAGQVEQEVRHEVAEFLRRGVQPGLTAVRVGSDPASEVYVRNKARKAEEVGIRGKQLHLPATTTETDLLAQIDSLNRDPEVDGILVQLPLPRGIDTKKVTAAIDPGKDVDGFHPVNVGRLQLGLPSLVPCTPAGVMRLLESTGVSLRGMYAVVVGRSDIVGKPVTQLLQQKDVTTTLCHSHTKNLARILSEAEIVIAAIGRPYMITETMIRPGAIVIDVGINRIERGSELTDILDEDKRRVLERTGSVLVGDVHFPTVRNVSSWITPVPGGVGPMTIAMLMKNTLQAAAVRRGIETNG